MATDQGQYIGGSSASVATGLKGHREPFAKMQGPQNVGPAPPPLLRVGGVGNKVLLDHSSQSPQEETPVWLIIRQDGVFVCSLCKKVATEAHLSSFCHRKNLWWYDDLGADYWLYAPGAEPTLEPLKPLHWGNPAYYEWKSMSKNFWCTLCNKTVTNEHLASDKHQIRAMWPESYGFNVPATYENGLANLQGVPLHNRALQPEQETIQWQAHWDAKSGCHSWTCARTMETRLQMTAGVPYFEIF